METGAYPKSAGRPYPEGVTNFTKEELDAAIGEAHRLGLKVIVHASGYAVKVALDAGADAITHGDDLTPELIALLKQKNSGIIVTHTVGFGRYYPERWSAAAKVNSPVEWLAGWREAITRARRTDAEKERYVQARFKELKALKDAGVIVAAGTDNGPGLVQSELEFLVDAGFTPLEAITAGTGATAKLLSIDGEVGTIQKGRFADIIGVPGRPDQNIRDLNDVRFIMANGRDLTGISWK